MNPTAQAYLSSKTKGVICLLMLPILLQLFVRKEKRHDLFLMGIFPLAVNFKT
jgi:hypothetical protein